MNIVVTSSLSVIVWVDVCGDHASAPLRSPVVETHLMYNHSHCPLWTHNCIWAEVRLPMGCSQPMTKHSGYNNSVSFLISQSHFCGM